jgi:hypothetical protein
MVSGAHRPVGIFGASGPGIRKGFDAGELSILDVAPTILYSLGLPIYKSFEGRVPQEIFEKGIMENKPINKAADPGEPQETDQAAETETSEMSEEDERVVMERLRELGYIE